MKKRPLGRTGLQVTEICLGTMTWGSTQNTEADAHEQMDYAFDHGIDFFDTAEIYAVPPTPETQGLTETYIGNWFKKTGKRDKIILASKVAGIGIPWIRDGVGLVPKDIETAINGSLKRLQTDHIDLYQMHWPNRANYKFGNNWVDWSQNDYNKERDTIHVLLETFDRMIKAGKIRHIGLSNDTSWGISQYIREAEQNNLPRIASIQNEYSLMYRRFDTDTGECAIAEDVGLLAYSPLAGGVISGKYLDGARPKGARYSANHRNMHRVESAEVDQATRAYIDLAKKYGMDVCQMALAWCLTRPFMTSVIIGATTMEQLKSDIDAVKLTLPPELLAEIDRVYMQNAMPF